jgi:hypothetical protein
MSSRPSKAVAWVIDVGADKPAWLARYSDDYPLEYYEDGYPQLPACLDRRRNQERFSEAA